MQRGREEAGSFFHSARCKRRECVAGVNQSTSSGIRLYGTPEFWMTSRNSRDGARCAKNDVKKHLAFLFHNLLKSLFYLTFRILYYQKEYVNFL